MLKRLYFNRYFHQRILFQTKIPWARSTTNSLTKKVTRHGPPQICIHQSRSEQDNDKNNTTHLRDLIATTGLVILHQSDPNRRFFDPCDLKLWGMTLQNNREPLPCLWKLCVAFQSHPWIRFWVIIRKHSRQSQIVSFSPACDLEILQMTFKTIGASSMLLQALCIIWKPSVYWN